MGMSAFACALGSLGLDESGAGELARVVLDDGVSGAGAAALGVVLGVERRERLDMVLLLLQLLLGSEGEECSEEDLGRRRAA